METVSERSTPIKSSDQNAILQEPNLDAGIGKDGKISSKVNLNTEKPSENVTLLIDSPAQAKRKIFIVRASWSMVMILAFLFIIVYLQQVGCLTLVFLLQIFMYKELMTIGQKPEYEVNIPVLKYIIWIWFFTISFLTYGIILEPHLVLSTSGWRHNTRDRRNSLFSESNNKPLRAWILGYIVGDVERIYFISFMVYITGLALFVFSLRRRYFRYQLQRFAYSHVVLLIVTAQSSTMGSNMFQGLIWFLLPTSLVICNDIWAFIFGFFFGKTPLISLSPKKTWEGFVGGFLATLFFGSLMSRMLSHFSLMTCPKLGFRLEYWPSCTLDPLFETYSYPIHFFGIGPKTSITVSPMDKHVIIFVLFASLMAPFGGFFASGFKRAFKIKDFGTLIPGHGGFVDRMDCQVMMGMFVYMYLKAFVIPFREEGLENRLKMEQVTRLIKMMTDQEQAEIYRMMGQALVADNLI